MLDSEGLDRSRLPERDRVLATPARKDTTMGTITVPKAIENFIAANNAHDAEALLAVFNDEATVFDDGKTYTSGGEIRAWIQSHLIDPKIVLTPISFENDRLIASGAGQYPGSPLPFAFTFATKDDLVTDLSIEPA
ncbi:nuclear transport factor 2 family protein [Kribbella sp. NBC_00662]|uniref:nuclear transport factor 2 family protein n=1 Tax=Kribbella sp. NBC_00662 TaxID=2975969 RepID=UPI003254826A